MLCDCRRLCLHACTCMHAWQPQTGPGPGEDIRAGLGKGWSCHLASRFDLFHSYAMVNVCIPSHMVWKWCEPVKLRL